MQLRKVIKRYLDERGIRASTLAHKTGIPKATLLGWMAGKIPRDFVQLRKLARHLEISLEELIFDEDGHQPATIFDAKNTPITIGPSQPNNDWQHLILEVKVLPFQKL